VISGIVLLAGCAGPAPTVPTSSPTASSLYLPHAVLADAGAGRELRLHVASVVDGGRFMSGFGWRNHAGGGGANHSGIDISAPPGTPIRAAAAGEVVEVGHQGAFGRMVRIRHSAELETLYAHLSSYARDLEIGRRVRQDEVIGYVGSSGRASGPHLHFEVHRNGRAIDPLALPALPRGG
jgi:murein DD-endopeptidase MepM/ murein hydrolase activator NlpD